jgi:ATP-dependent Clp protease ATP-binding subunit ClpA
MDASNLLKPALAQGTLRCIGSTTYKEYRNYFEKDRALVRRFQKIDVNEPTVEDAIKILQGLKTNYEKHHKVRYTPEAIKAAVELSAKYIHDRKLPDKAIDVIDEVGASRMLLPENRRRKTVTLKDVEEVVAKIARIPPKSVSNDDKETLRNLERDLKSMVFGQDGRSTRCRRRSSCPAPACATRRSRSATTCSAARPASARRGGEAALQDARHRARALRHVEYMERHSVSRLIGAPPGYVASTRAAADGRHRPAPALRAAARRDREGAPGPLQHPAAGDGPREAHRPQRQDGGFPQRHPHHDHQRRRGGHGQAGHRLRRTARSGEDEEAIKRMFTPEFRNRLDAVISFAGLTQEIVARVVDKFVMQLEAQLADRNVTIELSSAAREWLAEQGYDPLYGARPLARVIQEHIKKPLAEELLFGRLAKGGAVKVGLKDGVLGFDYIEAAPPALPKPEEGEGDAPEREPETAE